MNSSNLLKKLNDAFPDTMPPESDSLISHNCPDCLKLRDDFQGKTWQEVSNEVIENHTNDLPLFTAEAFNYYVPAYIRHVLEIEDSYVTTAEFLIHCFYTKDDAKQELRHKERMEKFTKEQIGFLTTFLDTLQKDNQYLRLKEDIAWSLEELTKYQ